MEIKDYIKYMANDELTLSDDQLDQLFKLIDTDNDGQIDKQEMVVFLKKMMSLHFNLKFKESYKYLQRREMLKEKR